MERNHQVMAIGTRSTNRGKGYWDKAFASNLYKEIVYKRFGVVVPVLIGFSVLFFILFTVQQFFKGLADAYGNREYKF